MISLSAVSEAPRRKSMDLRTVASRGAPDTALRLSDTYLDINEQLTNHVLSFAGSK
jgi:hypothetical protein